MHFGAQTALLFKQGPARFEIQGQRRLESKRAGAASNRVSSVKQRHGCEHHASVVESFDVNHCGQIMRAIKF